MLALAVLCASAWCADPAPLSQRTDAIESARRIGDAVAAAFGVAATATLSSPGIAEHLPQHYPERVGQSIMLLPQVMAAEASHQKGVARIHAARLGIDPRAVDSILDALDRIGGTALAEAERPDAILRAFDVYRSDPTRFTAPATAGETRNR